MSTDSETRIGDDEDLIINLEEPEAEAPAQGAKPPPVPGPSKIVAPQGALAELQQQIENERRERERATEVARQLAAERDQALAFVQQAEKRDASNYEQQCDNYIRSGQEQMEALSTQYENALGDGDFKEAADINRKISRLSGQIAVLERDKTVWQQNRDRRIASQQRQQPQPQQQARERPTDPVERAIEGRTEPTKAFLRKHTDLIRGDGTLKRIAVEAHEKALDAGMEVDSDNYFRHIEQTLGVSVPNGGNAVTRPQGAPTMAAPISRGAGPGGGGAGTFVMTARMRRLADEQGVTPQEWANSYIKLLKEGKVTPIT